MIIKKFSKKLFSILLSAAILLAALPVSTTAFAHPDFAATFFIDKGNVLIKDGVATGYDWDNTKIKTSLSDGIKYRIVQYDSNIPTSNTITIVGPTTAAVILEDINIEVPNNTQKAPLLITGNTKTIVYISNSAKLKGCNDCGNGCGTAGIQVELGSQVDIYSTHKTNIYSNDPADDSLDVLTATGGLGAAGIGGGFNSGYLEDGGNRTCDTGKIRIWGGTIYAKAQNSGNPGGAGIGGGRNGSFQQINMFGAIISATGGTGASGIGEGGGRVLKDYAASDEISIERAVVNACCSSHDQPDIGSHSGATKKLTILDGTVNAGGSGYLGVQNGTNYINGGCFNNVKGIIGKGPFFGDDTPVYPVKMLVPGPCNHDVFMFGLSSTPLHMPTINDKSYYYRQCKMMFGDNNLFTMYAPEGQLKLDVKNLTTGVTNGAYIGTVSKSQPNEFKIDSPIIISNMKSQYVSGELIHPTVTGGNPSTSRRAELYTGVEGTIYSSIIEPRKVGKYTYSYTITGDKYYYDQTASCNFEVIANTTDLTINPIPDQMYTGKPFTPKVTVRAILGTQQVEVPDTFYDLQYNTANTAIATYILKAIGKGDLDGYIATTQYNVVPRKITFSQRCQLRLWIYRQ